LTHKRVDSYRKTVVPIIDILVTPLGHISTKVVAIRPAEMLRLDVHNHGNDAQFEDLSKDLIVMPFRIDLEYMNIRKTVLSQERPHRQRIHLNFATIGFAEPEIA
jgi:hypothetical protein